MMDQSHLDQVGKSSPETLSDSSLSPDSPDSNDIFGEPLVHPRVGDEYQVEIPSLQNKSELRQLMKNPAESKGSTDSSHSFLMGLPLPVMWICNQAYIIKDRMECPNDPHAIYTNGFLESKKNVGISQISSVTEEPNVKVEVPKQTYWLVPGQSSALWSEFEADSFLLGLYLFGKNLLQVMRFMESKGMGQILAYYYGRFYVSGGYRRWSECRKMRNKKCVLGHRFFTGYRQHELFARLAPRLSEESKTNLLEVSRAFAEGRTTLDEYVFSLKALVGIHGLVEAVGIGKGKEDLTTFILDGSKNSQILTNRPEIPSGKACSSLTCAEIVKYLTGDFRLSKARSNDLFWEAVWPRLLARGWHSEQPRGDGYASTKNGLVFLMPGIKKFSRRKLSKGDHYFDSISDVLAKVASDPELLELETDEIKPSSSKIEENGWSIAVKSDDDQDSSDHERHCYLKPRVSSEISNLFKFTVVDTSLAHEDNPSKVRELRSLPHEAKRSSSRKSDLKSEVNTDTMRNGLQSPALHAHLKESKSVAGGSEQGSINLEPLKKPADANLPTDLKSRTIKHQFSRRLKSGPSSCSVTKKRKLASCVEADLTCVLSLPAKKKKKAAASRVVMTNDDAVPSGVNQFDNLQVVSMEQSAARHRNENVLQDQDQSYRVSSDVSQENETNPINQTVIDLNLPQVSSEPECDDKVKQHEGENIPSSSSSAVGIPSSSSSAVRFPSPSSSAVGIPSSSSFAVQIPSSNCSAVQIPSSNCSAVQIPSSSSSAVQIPSSSSAVGPVNKVGDSLDQQPRRQSTRNRPLTTKALEALEIGFLSPVRHSRKRSSSTTLDQKSKRTRQPRSKSSMYPPAMDFEVRASTDENCNGNSGVLTNATPTEKTAMTRELLGLPETSFSPAASSKEMFT
ncbi:uncharacterized protein LOC110708653 [Chenopodium quinoa]|uniref:uncharacterized protein LOC110708653 n=1 Tax=Chenopodium quinoa TaxID=63459 RepID=UPI000B78E2D1|nr:uncharacterized protein LOC110708653 [Chenopodium quinoa]